MDITKRYRPISYLKTNTADVAKEVSEQAGPVVITQNGVPSFVCVSLEQYYQTQETNALIKIVNLGQREIKKGKFKPLAEARKSLDALILKDKAANNDKD